MSSIFDGPGVRITVRALALKALGLYIKPRFDDLPYKRRLEFRLTLLALKTMDPGCKPVFGFERRSEHLPWPPNRDPLRRSKYYRVRRAYAIHKLDLMTLHKNAR
ncbi:hypothetical protein DPMN_143587 [Dreissena polymorpha]|uniref:Uncharacterized protein n=1 Tax=Dreissena polymorpha TaxID=45954 RepID=A0A9D4GGM5_DREPO|nr:hypothetical protein DPMN_143587 [Dreissena polymorpha]